MYADDFMFYHDGGDVAIINMGALRRWYGYINAGRPDTEIARCAGISRTTLWRLKRGKRIAPATAHKLAVGLWVMMADYPNTRAGLTDRLGVLMEVQKPLF